MKQLFIPIFLLLASQLPAQQLPEPCEAGDCYCIYESARKVWKAGMYELAVNKLNAWKTCDPDKVEYADDLIIDIFKEVDGLKKKAEAAKAEADSLLHKNEKIINAIYFYAGRVALAYGERNGNNGYYYIDKNGDYVEKLGVWNEGEQFDWTGFAKVGKKDGSRMRDYLLDTLGNFYPVAYDINDLDKTITALDLSRKELVTIPEIVFQQVHLKVLLLNGNQLSNLPEEIWALKNLMILYLDGNQLRSLSERIGELKSLTILNLKGNHFSSLPESIGELKNLTSLDMSYNQLSGLPEGIGELKSLTSLFLMYNQLSSLPESIGKLKSLTELYLSGNPLPRSEKEKLRAALPNCKISF